MTLSYILEVLDFMIIDDEILNDFNATIASSAQQFHELAESMEKTKRSKKKRNKTVQQTKI